jgi:acyl-CoA synthetase (AMP-forming)/AMP-acid ligase II
VTDPRLHRHLGTVLERVALGPDRHRVAVVFEESTRDFATLHENALRVANGLRGLGIRRGDRVGVLLRNGIEWVELLFGLAHAGAVAVPVNVLLGPVEIAQLCADAQLSAFVVDQGGWELYAQLDEKPELLITVSVPDATVTGARLATYDALLRGEAVPVLDGPSLEDPLIFYYTSGTTGLPKASVHTHNGVLWNSYHQVPDLGIGRDEVCLVVPSLSWAAGFNDLMLATMWMAGRSVIMPTGGVTIERVVETIERHGVTSLLLVPTLLKQLIRRPDLEERLRATALRSILTGSEPVPLPVIEHLVAALPNASMLQGFGLSEFPTVATMLRPEEAISHVGTAGRACSITRIAVMTTEGEIRDVGEGEVLLRSMATMRGYWNRPEETAAAFADGWLHTGDIGTIDADGFLTITGRKKDMIISGGLNVYPSEIEAVLHRVPGVREASVVGVPDDRWGEIPVAVVVSDESLDEEAVLAYCASQLAGYKRPRRILQRQETLPRNPSGKILKREITPWAIRTLEENR